MHFNYSSTLVRLVIHIILTVNFALLNLVGGIAKDRWLKLKVLHGRRRIVVSEAYGWLSGSNVLGPFQPFWRVPRSIVTTWWSAMAALAFLAVGTTWLTSTVREVHPEGLCTFQQGLVISTTVPDSFSVPPNNGKPTLVAGEAQRTSLTNGCPMGIIWKVDQNPWLCANVDDILGTWVCTQTGNDVPFDQGTLQDDVVSQLYEQGLLYSVAGTSWASTTNGDGLWNHLVVWGSSASDGDNTTFDVQVVVDTTASQSGTQFMRPFHCSMNAPAAVPIVSQIPSVSALAKWASVLQGYMYSGARTPIVDDPEDTLAWYLNTMVMVAGGSDSLLSSAPPGSPNRGCLITQTYVSTVLIILLLASVAAMVIMALLALYFAIRVSTHPHSSHVKNLPSDIWGWMVYAIMERDASRAGTKLTVVKVTEISGREFGTAGDSVVRVKSKQESETPLDPYPGISSE
ncbi:hypothetical protein B0A55_08407 [Friedmanniomyces simplex]|uniref:Uncharacterized protein n=1 Tax=Friedmanniomyces simplex TaxID=329884 RepID=A0A4U0WVY9_9PEZI|nr:hypothetical protein B0A55_08407 [Friedmanniomyces simplex]